MYDNPFWYKYLKKSPYTPPDYVFGVVWTFLYTLMAISLLLVLQTTSFFSKPVLLFMTQMLFNIAWSPLFFKYKLIRLALVDLLLLVVVLLFTIRAFYNIKPVAAYLLLPYLAWLGLAGYLNTYIVFNN